MFKYYLSVLKIFETMLNLCIVMLYFFRDIFNKKEFSLVKKAKNVFVLGNGPSLKNDLDQIINLRSDNDSVMVVNSFSKTPSYVVLKPEYYVIADPGFFVNDPTEDVEELQDVTFQALVDNTSWEMWLILPQIAKKCNKLDKLKSNKNIKIQYYKSKAIYGGKEKINNWLFRNNLANPMFFNVLSACIFFSIKMRFNQIFIWGSDHSWHEDYTLSSENIIYTLDKHFYDDSAHAIPHVNLDGTYKKVHEEFYSLARAFESYHILRKLANSYNITIKNYSSKSWIDAYDKL